MSLKTEIIKKLSKQYDLPQYKIEDVINSYFELAAFTLKNGTDLEKKKFPTVGIPYMGKFFVPDFKIEKYYEALRTKGTRS
jgi:nucleoid DNA-binding protein